jgi:hypothetical protein
MCEGISPVDLAATEQVFWIRMKSSEAGLFRGQLGLALKAFQHHPYTGCPEGLTRVLQMVLGTSDFDLFVRVTPLDAYNMLDQGAPYSVIAHAGYEGDPKTTSPDALFELMSAHAARNPFVLPDESSDSSGDGEEDPDDEEDEDDDDGSGLEDEDEDQ